MKKKGNQKWCRGEEHLGRANKGNSREAREPAPEMVPSEKNTSAEQINQELLTFSASRPSLVD
jgi:hypothetical protein